MIVAFDPSSTVFGYCVSGGPGDKHDFGLLKPDRRKDEAIDRAVCMAIAACDLVGQVNPSRVVVETPAPQAPKMGQRGQATYGLAVGVLLGQIAAKFGRPLLVTVRADVWTRRVPKEKRAARLASQYGLSFDGDGGLDAADAFGLAEWWWAVGQHEEAAR